MKDIRNVLLIINTQKEIPDEFLTRLTDILTGRGCSLFVFKECAKRFDSLSYKPTVISQGSAIRSIDIAIVLGGDGSIINASTQVCAYMIPILSINFGTLGYLTELEAADVELVNSVLDGSYTVEERMMLIPKIVHADGSVTYTPPALNDIVLSNGPIARILNFNLSCDDVLIQRHRADGMIIATPTGSTAYSMSAGGPVLAPELDAICMTPICSHSFANRPVIVPGSSTIKLSELGTVTGNSVYITVDGRFAEKLEDTDSVIITRSESKTRLIRLRKNNFLTALNSKLQEV